MIDIDTALKLVLENLPPPVKEHVSMKTALGRVVAEDLAATSDIPPFHRASMDGYAVRASDLVQVPARLRYAGEIRAGGGTTTPVGAGEAVAIMTGAPVPDGADAVQMIEKTEKSADGREIVFHAGVRPGENIAPAASEARRGEVVLARGRILNPAAVAVLATFGYAEVPVYAQPRVAILATGDELVEVEKDPGPDQIRNSNAYSLTAQLKQMGLSPSYLGISRDTREDLKRFIAAGLGYDVLLLTGGVSMGEYDLVKTVFDELEIEVFFTKVAMKPGKPTVFGRKGRCLVFGLPGNPVSTFIAFENFVRPAVGRICGFSNPELPRISGELQADMRQRKGRTAFLPARVAWSRNGWKIQPCPWKGSADIVGFSAANATVIFPADRESMQKGEEVQAMLLPHPVWEIGVDSASQIS